MTALVHSLEQAGIEYMLTGSLASSLQGEPRSTHDIDVVVSLQPSHAGTLVSAFPPPRYYLSHDSVHDAIQRAGMFNLLDIESGEKVDFWLLTDDDFDQSRFARRRQSHFAGQRVSVSSPEDTILAKLRWCRMSGGSEKQFGDALHVYEVQGSSLDQSYLEAWAETLNVTDLWQRVRSEAEPVQNEFD